VKRKITLNGLAWRSQVASSILNIWAIILSIVISFIIFFLFIVSPAYGEKGDGIQLKNFMLNKKYIINCLFGLPDVTVIAIGVVIVISILLLAWGLWFNPKSDT
jgi:hypothetical protein